jgi:2-keto-4-pentenoate hydratase
MPNTSIEQIAEILLEAKISGKPCSPIRDILAPNAIAEAYQIQAIGIEKELKKGQKVTGKKIGLTAETVQKQLGVNEPDFGTLLNGMKVGENNQLAFSELMQPKAEAELAFVLKKDISTPIESVEELQDYIDYVLVAIEIVGSRIQNWDIQIVDTVADNASASHYAIGAQKIPLDEIDLIHCQMQLYQNNMMVSQGKGEASMGNPLKALQWLANKMIEMNTPLQKGELILSGALGPMVNLKKGDSIEVKIDAFNPVHLEIC